MKLIDQIKDAVSGREVFGEPFRDHGLTVIPAVRVRGGGGGGGMEPKRGDEGSGGGGGFGLDARPAGAFVIRGEEVRWIPSVDVNKIAVGAQLVVLAALLTWRSVMRAKQSRG